MTTPRRQHGLTLIEILTALVALVVIAAVAVTLWHTRELRERRQAAMELLFAVQAAEDRHFGTHARYAALDQLDMDRHSAGYSLELELTADGLGYVATARAVAAEGQRADARCAEMRLDQHGRRSALSAAGEDSSADCWSRP